MLYSVRRVGREARVRSMYVSALLRWLITRDNGNKLGEDDHQDHDNSTRRDPLR